MDKSMLGKAFVTVYEHALASQDVDRLTADQRAILESMIDELTTDRESAVSKLRRASKQAFLPRRTGIVA